MDAPQFDGLARSISGKLTRRTGLGLLAGLGLPFLGLTGDADGKKKKITLCLNGQTVKKPKKAAKKLLKKGATRGACVPLRCGNGGPCTVFMAAVDTGFTGAEIGGLAGGDAKCQATANAANLPGTYMAWLSVGSDTPGTRFTNIDKAGPYRLVPNAGDGGNPPPTVAENFADLLTCGGGTCLNNAIDRNENGQVQGGNPGVWTGTLANGNASADTCSGWTTTSGDGATGSGTSTAITWTESIAGACTFKLALYCFEQAT